MRKTTSIKVDEQIWKEARINCIKKDLEISEYIEKLIKEDLRKK